MDRLTLAAACGEAADLARMIVYRAEQNARGFRAAGMMLAYRYAESILRSDLDDHRAVLDRRYREALRDQAAATHDAYAAQADGLVDAWADVLAHLA